MGADIQYELCRQRLYQKQRCGGGLPCARCERLDVACSYRDGVTVAPANPARVHPKLQRVRSGCAACKARRKKCDEVKPKCGDCKRLNSPCQWPRTSNIARSFSPLMQGNGHPDCQGHPDLDDRDEEAIQRDLSNEDGVNGIVIASWSRINALSPSKTLTLLPNLNEIDRSLLNHYIQAVADVFNRCPGDSVNPFIERLLPIAYSSEITLSAMLSLSGVHWRRVYPKAYTRSLVHQGKAISGLASSLNQPSSHVGRLQAITTVLLLCLSELADGKSTAWQYHLDAAGKLLRAKTMYKTKTSDHEFLYSLFHYLDAMATISSCKRPLLESESDYGGSEAEGRSVDEGTILSSSDVAIEAIYGVPRRLFDFVGRMNSLAQRRATRDNPELNERFEVDAALLEIDIDMWRCSYDSTTSGASSLDNRKARSASEALEWAIRLRLHQILHGYDNTHLSVRNATSRILDAIASIRSGSRIEGCLLFPLVIAGASTESEEQRVMVRQRLMVMENTLGFGHITAALQLLEKVWKASETHYRKSNEAPIINWASVRYHEFPGMAFL